MSECVGVLLCGFGFEQRFDRAADVGAGQAEVPVELRARGRFAEPVDAEHATVRTDVVSPERADAGLDRDPRSVPKLPG